MYNWLRGLFQKKSTKLDSNQKRLVRQLLKIECEQTSEYNKGFARSKESINNWSQLVSRRKMIQKELGLTIC